MSAIPYVYLPLFVKYDFLVNKTETAVALVRPIDVMGLVSICLRSNQRDQSRVASA
jgi:hypothetical protein